MQFSHAQNITLLVDDSHATLSLGLFECCITVSEFGSDPNIESLTSSLTRRGEKTELCKKELNVSNVCERAQELQAPNAKKKNKQK